MSKKDNHAKKVDTLNEAWKEIAPSFVEESEEELTAREKAESKFRQEKEERRAGFYSALSNSFFVTYSYFLSLIILFFVFFFLTPREFLENLEWRGVNSILASYYLFVFVPIIYGLALLFQISLCNWRRIKSLRYRMQILGFFAATILFGVLFFPGY